MIACPPGAMWEAPEHTSGAWCTVNVRGWQAAALWYFMQKWTQASAQRHMPSSTVVSSPCPVVHQLAPGASAHMGMSCVWCGSPEGQCPSGWMASCDSYDIYVGIYVCCKGCCRFAKSSRLKIMSWRARRVTTTGTGEGRTDASDAGWNWCRLEPPTISALAGPHVWQCMKENRT